MKNMKIRLAVTMAVVIGFAATVQAMPITGGISLAGDYTVNTGDINTATAFTSFSDVEVTSTSGSFAVAGVTLATPGSVTMTPFTFIPFGAPVIPLWQTVLGPAAAFNLLAINVVSHAVPNSVTLAGNGTLFLTGYDPTPGTWVFTANQGGGTFSFSSSNEAQGVPDGGTTAMLLGGALAGLAFLRRKLS